MKILPVILLNLALVVIAIAIYHQMRDPVAPPGTMEGGTETSALERRLKVLEAERRPEGPDLRILERLTALEEIAEAGATPVAEPPMEPVSGAGTLKPRDASASPAATGEPDPESIREFRRLRDAVHREDRMKKIGGWVDRNLEKLGLHLSARQRSRITAAQVDFEPRKAQIWAEAKGRAQKTVTAGGAVSRAVVMAETTSVIQQEFAQMLGGVVSPADAEAIAKALNPR